MSKFDAKFMTLDRQNVLAHGLSPRCLAQCYHQSSPMYRFIMMSVMITCLLNPGMIWKMEPLIMHVSTDLFIYSSYIHSTVAAGFSWCDYHNSIFLCIYFNTVMRFLLFLFFTVPRDSVSCLHQRNNTSCGRTYDLVRTETYIMHIAL